MKIDLGRGRYAECEPGAGHRQLVPVIGSDGVREVSLGGLTSQSNGEIFGQLSKSARRVRAAEDYWMQHRPPDADSGAPLHDLTGNETYPKDIYTHPHYYLGGEPGDQEAMNVAYRVHGKPEAKVRIYRALPAEHAHKGFNPGDWVSTSREYARQHGRHESGDPKRDWSVISTRVPAKHLHTDGNSIAEYGYNGPATGGMVSFKGGYHEEISQRADGSIGPVQRRAPQDPNAEMWGHAVVKMSPEDYHHAVSSYDHREVAQHVLNHVDEVKWLPKDSESFGGNHVEDPSDPWHAEMSNRSDLDAHHPAGGHEPGTAPLLGVTLHTKNGKTIDRVGLHPHVEYGDQPYRFSNNYEIHPLGRAVKHPSLGQDKTAATGVEDSMMVALIPPQKVIDHLVQEDGTENADDLHITLLYLGKTARYSPRELEKLPELVRQWAKTQQPFTVRTQGAGTFVNEGEHPLWAAVDIPGGTRIHDSLVDFLRGHGIEITETHGFVPHITLDYRKWHVRFLPKVAPMEWQAEEVYYCRGGNWTPIKLGR